LSEFRETAQRLVLTAQRMAELKGAAVEATLLSISRSQLIETGYDNWNGGTTIFALTLEVPLEKYIEYEASRDALEASVLKRLKDLTRTESGVAIAEVVISPALVGAADNPSSETSPTAESAPSFWAPGRFRLFISHCSRVKESAHKLKAALAKFGIAAFVAHDDIEPTREWQGEIESALRTMDALCAILTPDFVSSKWCDQEVGMAIGRSKLVVPLRAGADPHGFLGKYQGLNTKAVSAEQLSERLFDVLIRNPQSAPRMADALIEMMESSNSWDSAKRVVALLEQVPALNAQQASRLLATIDLNTEVKDAHGVPSRIVAIVKRVAPPDAS
jgi:hypothetical protein